MAEFCYLLNVILVSRLALTFSDEPVTIRQTVTMVLVQIAGLFVYEIGVALAVLAGLLLATNIGLYLVEHRFERTSEPRLISLVAFIVTAGTCFSPWVALRFSPRLPGLLRSWGHYSLFFSPAVGVNVLQLNTVLLGLLLIINEANILIRYAFRLFNLAPKKPVQTDKRIIMAVDERAYNAGRIIGILERIFVYFFVFNAQYAAMGLILAAKSFTRFKELEKREFAEYVLIGTLLSTLLATLAAAAVRLALS